MLDVARRSPDANITGKKTFLRYRQIPPNAYSYKYISHHASTRTCIKENKDTNKPDTTNPDVEDETSINPEKLEIEGTKIELSDTEVLVDGTVATDDNTKAVYVARDIIYYEEGHDFTYGEGEKEDEHSREEAE